MAKRRLVPKLETLAFEVGFKSIIADLSTCAENCISPQKKNECLNSFSVLLGAFGLKNANYVCDFVRNRLDHGLMGLVSDSVRQKFVETLNKSYYKDTRFILRPSAFLASVLDKSFNKLEVVATDPGLVPDIDLIPVISKHSPQLTKLTLDFFSCGGELASRGNFVSVLCDLWRLPELSDFSLKNVPRESDDDVAVLAKYCPKLMSLRLCPLQVTSRLLLGIITPEFRKLEDLGVRIIYRLQLNEEVQNRLCKTLKYLDFEGASRQKYDKIKHSRLCDVVAFLLRHLPNLEVLKLSNALVAEAIVLLWENPKPDISDVLSNLATEIHGKFSGKLKLTEISHVDLYSAKQLEAISELCPALRSVNFTEAEGIGFLEATTNTTPSPEIQNLLRRFTNIQSVSFLKVCPKALTTVVQLWANQLTSLEITGPVEISAGLLARCPNLTELCLGRCCAIKMSDFDCSKSAFLPRLEKVTVTDCLKESSEANATTMEQLLLLKPSLKTISVECCHLAQNNEAWIKIFKQWSNMESLKICSAHDLCGKVLPEMPRLMPRLKSVTLPNFLQSRLLDRQALNLLKENWELQGIVLNFESLSNGYCRERPEVPKWEFSEAEDGSDYEDFDDDEDGVPHIFHIHGARDEIDEFNMHHDVYDFDSEFDDDDDYDDYDGFDDPGWGGHSDDDY